MGECLMTTALSCTMEPLLLEVAILPSFPKIWTTLPSLVALTTELLTLPTLTLLLSTRCMGATSSYTNLLRQDSLHQQIFRLYMQPSPRLGNAKGDHRRISTL